jgi:endonuclease/exonuclease/phosphatase (EEP) superfamily protein YafD
MWSPNMAELRGALSGLALGASSLLAAISINVGLPGQELLQTLRFHVVAGFVPLVLLLFLAGARWRALGFLVLLVLSAGQGGLIVLDQLQRRAPLEARAVAGSLSLISFNVLVTNTEGRRIADFLAQAKPDIAIVMETSGIADSLSDLDATFATRVGCQTPRMCDIAVFSRVPLADVQVLQFGPFRRERLIIATTRVAGQTVTIIAAHLSKPYFDDFAWIELTQIRTLLRSITGPVIMAGDFNSAAWSYSVARFARQMELVPPPTYPATWPVELAGLGLPIDNMFSRGGALIRTLEAIPDPMGSNHRGLVAQIDILEPIDQD